MSTQVKEMIEQAMENSGRNISPDFKPKLMDALLKIYEDNKTPKEALEITDELMETMYHHAYTLFKAGKYQKAADFFETLLKFDYTDPRLSFACAACYHYMKDYEKAAVFYFISKEADPLNPIPSFHLYDCYMHLDKPVAASEALAAVIAKSEHDPKYSQLRERALLEKENLIHHMRTFLENNDRFERSN